MPNQRIMVGVQDFSGTKHGTLAIGDMVRRNPEPVYASECRCGAKSTVTQRELRNGSARCRAAGCGKTVAPDKSRASELARQVKEREIEAQRLRDEASAARMASETQGHKLTSSRPPVSDDPGPMRERDRISLRALRDEEAARERAEREAREAPVRAAQQKLTETYRELARVERERLEATVKDPDAYSDPVLNGQRMTEEQADTFNRSEFAKYRADHPDVFVPAELIDNLGRYFARNGQALVSSAMLDRAITRFRDASLLPERPAPAPVTKRIETPAPAKPLTYIGRDPQTGLDREYSQREVDRMSADQFRRTFPVVDSIGELFTLQSRLRGR